jgi:hypothetical protein
MQKIDYKKELQHLYEPSVKDIKLVDVPEMNFLMIDGQGDPNTCQEFSDSVEALYALSYALKFMIKKGELQVDYGVMPLEGLWWADDMTHFSVEDKSNWKWTVMIMQPAPVTPALVAAAYEQVEAKKNPVALGWVRFKSFAEGRAAQIMHVGPFSEEGPTIERLHEYIQANGYACAGKHHEIYLSDIRKAAPENWKTVIRQPIGNG